MPGNGRDQKNSFHPGKPFADAATRSTAKRKVSELRSRFARLRDPTIRVKFERFGEVARISVHDKLAHQYQRFPRHDVTADLEVLHGEPAEGPGRRIQSHRFS